MICLNRQGRAFTAVPKEMSRRAQGEEQTGTFPRQSSRSCTVMTSL